MELPVALILIITKEITINIYEITSTFTYDTWNFGVNVFYMQPWTTFFYLHTLVIWHNIDGFNSWW